MFEQFEIEDSLIIENRNSMKMKIEGMNSNIFTSEGSNDMRLIEVILDDESLNEAVKRVKSNKGVAGVDKMTVYEIDIYFQNNIEQEKENKKVYILDAEAAIYMIPINNYNKDYDMFLKGNIGKEI